MHVMIVPSWYATEFNKVHGSFFKEQALALQRSGIKVSIAFNEIWPLSRLGRIKSKRGLSCKNEDGLTTYRYKNYNYLPKNPRMFNIFNRRMEKIYKSIVEKEGKVDVIHAHSALWGGISAAYISQKYGIPLVLTEHSSLKYAQYLKDSYRKYVYEAYMNSNKLVSVSESLKTELQNYVSNKDIVVINNIVDFNNFTLDKRNDSYNETEKFTFFSCAFLEPDKGMDILIKAFNKGFKNSENVVLRIGGAGRAVEELKSLIEELDLKDKVMLLGALSREEVSEEMQKCNCFALASRHETFGMVYVEALASGKPVIGTKNGGAEEIINENNGLLVEIDNTEELCEAMKYIYCNLNKYTSEMLRKECEEIYSEKNIVSRIKSVYEEVL
ncbi:glycosyltransferase [Inconstantimicrobium mannanitabidum]|uniref:Glycosyl transferase family 1 n=1 Tax=Inconstantimicrobium mannanitabidum TaxID=1604901 RepID=A0ACB5RA97_9CLOT|nr:glycosyltransferase [Clostridium sp. TW13]GKX66108.1 glycosyl transferase family 1 [Clostridium sp. TW13]